MWKLLLIFAQNCAALPRHGENNKETCKFHRFDYYHLTMKKQSVKRSFWDNEFIKFLGFLCCGELGLTDRGRNQRRRLNTDGRWRRGAAVRREGSLAPKKGIIRAICKGDLQRASKPAWTPESSISSSEKTSARRLSNLGRLSLRSSPSSSKTLSRCRRHSAPSRSF